MSKKLELFVLSRASQIRFDSGPSEKLATNKLPKNIYTNAHSILIKKMEVLKDYPEEFAKLFRPSFNYLIHINLKFHAADKGFVGNDWRFLIVISCMSINYVTQLWKLAHKMSEGKIFEIANLLPPCLISTQAILKYIVLAPKTPALSSMISELGVLWSSSELNTTQRQARDTLLRRLNLCNGVSYWVGILGTSQFLLSPLAETLVRRLLLQQDTAPLLPLDCRYPFSVSSWPLYAALYAFQVYSMSLTVCAYLGPELLMITLCALLGVEFTALCDRLHHVTAPSPAGHCVTSPPAHRAPSPAGHCVTAPPDRADHTWTLGHILKRHQTLCLLAKKLDAAFNRMIFINLMFVGLTTCFFRYAAQFSRGPTYMINNYAAMFSSLLYVLYLCYFGELLTGAYSSIFRMVLGLLRWRSAFGMFTQAHTAEFHAIIRKKVASLIRRVRGSHNSLLKIVAEDFNAPVLRHFVRSLGIGDMAYQSEWFQGNIHHKKAILIMMLRSHTPCCLTSMKYAPVTLNMFTKVMSSTWSYFSLMNTVYEDS